ncbi:MAG: class I SAM-dependent DNA methyltransferase [Enterococcus sp.]
MENVFEKMAQRYDTPERIALAQIISREIARLLPNSQEKTMIDYGGGTGLVSLPLAKDVKSLLLVDAAGAMLQLAQHKIDTNALSHVSLMQADFTQEVPAIKADIIMLSLVLLHIPETKQILQTLFELLNEQGVLVLVDFNTNQQAVHPKIHSGFEQAQLAQLLKQIGFTRVESQTFHQGERLFMNQDASLFSIKAQKG